MQSYRTTRETMKTDSVVKINKLIIYKETLKILRKTSMKDNKRELKCMMIFRM